MNWITPIVALVGTFLGAVITWWTERRRWRREQDAKRIELRRVVYGEYLAALHAASEGIRDVSEAVEPDPAKARAAFRAGNIYAAREQVGLLAPAEVVKVAKLAFRQLRELRDLAAADAPRKARHYDSVLVEYGVTLDRLRECMREDLGIRPAGRKLQAST